LTICRRKKVISVLIFFKLPNKTLSE
jgi:hypothetical protein